MGYKKDFPAAKKITYFDSAALVLKPKISIDAVLNYYQNISISSRTADTPLGNLVNSTINSVREKVAQLIDAQKHEVIFTSGTTESLNYIANMLNSIITQDHEILLSSYNHSSHIIPWIELAQKKQAKVIIKEDLINAITPKTKIIALAQETNNFKQVQDIQAIYQKAEQVGAYVINDCAQSILHQKCSLTNSHVIAFSCNKFYGPTGMGVLAIQQNLLKQLKPTKFGGGSVNEINTNQTWTIKDTIAKFEPGTPNLAGFFMFDKSLDYFNNIGYETTQKVLGDLSIYLHNRLNKLKNVEVFSNPGDYIALINVKNINAQDVATYLGIKGIYTIAGIFCAHYLRNIKSNYSYLRISLGIYNTKKDIDKLIYHLKNGGDFYGF
ncbi:MULTISPECIES: aminotransferase class V-fold PLP-dependent enzyme [unclassified Mycoplasma]|uniref:aminotransferase class V-fold PLP-dependent enzyme n=1 Tax=unclassified Mycoplasma TaxID=2683645 RepID=UPI00211C2418|nr:MULTISPECIES: aminotransferase class V-fold PLP-dependent enzyme [unclassified Mycoplasma]UUM19516.1 aminotransferase class V-fold PLP-dependent enzyme [Mycoplasma sp. 1578d]UUM24436.1 aminotransferase class V-fold PLP-dependent enzyme [Mycoplasma sp. 3686d]